MGLDLFLSVCPTPFRCQIENVRSPRPDNTVGRQMMVALKSHDSAMNNPVEMKIRAPQPAAIPQLASHPQHTKTLSAEPQHRIRNMNYQRTLQHRVKPMPRTHRTRRTTKRL